MECKTNLITPNSYVILQRGTFLKAYKIVVGRLQKVARNQNAIDFDGAIGQPYGSLFRIGKKDKRSLCLEKVDNMVYDEEIKGEEFGEDNRTITDDGTSQKLSKEDIKELVNSGINSNKLVQTIVSNSSTFSSKTKYSQEKYISKKRQKYEQYITLLKPTMRIVSKMYFSQEPYRIANLRLDALSQMLCYSNVSPEKSCLVYESGTLGLLTASVLSRVGTGGKVVYVYSGDMPKKEAIEIMDFDREHMKSLSYIAAENLPDYSSTENRQDFESLYGSAEERQSDTLEQTNGALYVKPKNFKFIRSRGEDVTRSCRILLHGVSNLLIASKSSSISITLALLEYLLPGNNFAVFSPHKEFLVSLFPLLKAKNCLNVQLFESWLREYQILPDRTHPDINMSGAGGYILTGVKVKGA